MKEDVRATNRWFGGLAHCFVLISVEMRVGSVGE